MSIARINNHGKSGNHPILQGLDSSWDSLRFWHYDNGSYVGWVTGVPGLADAEADSNPYTDVLAVSGSDIYIGWNVYGADASSNDLLLLENSIEYLVTGAVAGSSEAVPTLSMPALMLLLSLFALIALGYFRRSGTA